MNNRKRSNADALLVLTPHGTARAFMPDERDNAFAFAKRVGAVVCPVQVIADYRPVPDTESNAGGHSL